MSQSIRHLRALAHHAGLTFAEFVRGRKKEGAHIVSAKASLDAYRVRIEDAGLRFQPEVLCDRRI